MAKKHEKGGVLGLGYIPDARKRIADAIDSRVEHASELGKSASIQQATRRFIERYHMRRAQGKSEQTSFDFASNSLADEIDTIPALTTYQERGARRIEVIRAAMERDSEIKTAAGRRGRKGR